MLPTACKFDRIASYNIHQATLSIDVLGVGILATFQLFIRWRVLEGICQDDIDEFLNCAVELRMALQTTAWHEKLRGYPNSYSRRINEQHRLVYIVRGDTIELDRCWGHYE